MTATSSNGTSTTTVFTGQTASRRGAATATATTSVQVPPELCNGKIPTIVGTPGNDKLQGTSGNDVIVGARRQRPRRRQAAATT